MLLQDKWKNLIKKHTGVDVSAFPVGEDQLLVKTSGLDNVLEVMGFFVEHGKDVAPREEGLLITL
ncbi:hypothetical protein [Vibrio phage vB_ValS_PJ32]|nr:hypothetical protein [Vibrio phage vB_ValS_PJ32]